MSIRCTRDRIFGTESSNEAVVMFDDDIEMLWFLRYL